MNYGFGFHAQSWAWRVPCILQFVMLIPMLFLGFAVDETPRWLAAHDRTEESLSVLRRLNDGRLPEQDILAQYHDILNVVRVEKALGTGTWKDIIKSDSIQSRRRFLIACGIQIFQQAGG